MTRRLLTLLSILTALVLFTAALAAPVRVDGAALPPARTGLSQTSGLDIHLGDGIFRLRVRACEGCSPVLALEIAVPKVRLVGWPGHRAARS